jgi:polyisoprenoid-binding protein YceI
MNKSSLRLIGLTAVIAALAAHGQTTTFTAQPSGNSVKIDGTSTIHDWTVQGGIIGGSMELDSAFVSDPTKAQPGKIPAKVNVVIPVRTLKSGNGKMDTVMYQAMKQQDHPRIEYHLNELTLKETPKAADSPYNFDSKGHLVVAGVTNAVSFPVTMTRSDKVLKVSGTTKTKMTQFGIKPPTLIGILSTGDDVTLKFDWATAEKEAK